MSDRIENRNGSAILWVIAGIAGLGALAFFLSAPFSTKVKSSYRQATQWTARRIQTDPSGYLDWAISECSRFRADLEAHRLSLLSRRRAVDRARLRVIS